MILNRIPFSLIFKIGITILLFWGIFHKTDFSKVLIALKHLSLQHLCLLFLGFWGIQILIAQRWGFILKAQKQNLPFFILLKAVFIGYLFNQGLPSSIGGDVYRIIAIRQHNVSFGDSFSGVLFERLLGFFGLGVLCLICIPVEWEVIRTSLLLWPTIISATLFFVVFSGLIIAYFLSVSWLETIPLIKQFIPFVKLLQNILTHQKFLRPALITSICISVFSVINCMILLQGLFLNLTLSQSFLVFSIMFILSSIPISLGGWGIRESITIVIFGAYGISSDLALAFSLTYGVIQLISAFPGIIFWATSSNKITLKQVA